MLSVCLSLALAADLTVGPTGTYPTLDAAFASAADGDRLLVEPGTYVEPVLSVGTRTLTVEATAQGVLLRSTSNRRAFTIDGGDLTLVGLEVDLEDDLGLIQLRTGRVEVRDSTIRNARAPVPGQPGGSIDAEDGTVELYDCLMEGAVAPVKNGGHVYALRTDVTIERSTLTGGSAASGGTAYVDGGSLTIVDSTLSDDVGESATLFADTAPVTLTNTSVSNSGIVGLAVVDADVALTDATFDGHLGGAVQVSNGSVTATRLVLTNNPVGLVVTGGGVTSVDGTFEGHTGRAFTVDGGAVSLAGDTFTNNSGGAVHVLNGSLDGSATFVGNTGDEAVAVWAEASDVSLADARFEGNVATVADVVRCDGGARCALDTPTFQGNGGPGALLAARAVAAEVTGATVCLQDAATSLVAVDNAGSLSMSGSAVLANVLSGAAITVATDSSATLVNNSLVLQQAEGALLQAQGGLTLTNNLVAFATTAGPAVQATGTLGGGYNLYFGNTGGDVAPGVLPTDITGIDPGIGQLRPDSCDLDVLKPRYGSALIDAGDPTILDVDGSPSDIGAFGGESPNPDPGGEDDLDKDGWGERSDCDDQDPNVNPGVAEVLCNGVDDDCTPETADDLDSDGDGVGVCDDDCDDDDARVFEIVDVYLDNDRDGYGIGEPTPFCLPPSNSAPLDGDCDDADATVYPGAPETPYDGIDQDCDGVDLDDLDGDGALGFEDCDDEDPERFPANDEVPDDGIDQDCTGKDVLTTLNGGAGWRCGCASTAPAAGAWLLLPLMGLVRRRR